MTSEGLRAAGRGRTRWVVAGLLAAATALIALTWQGSYEALRGHPAAALALLALSVLALGSDGRGPAGLAGVGLLATGFSLGSGPAACCGVLAALLPALARRSRPLPALRDGARLALAAAAASAAYRLGPHGSALEELAPALAAAAVYCCLELGLRGGEALAFLSLGGRSRARAARPLVLDVLSVAPLALACAIAEQRVGPLGLALFAFPPALLLRLAARSARGAHAEARAAQAAVAELQRANAELHDLVGFAGGLARCGSESEAIAAFAGEAIERLVGGSAALTVGAEAGDGALELVQADRTLGALRLSGADEERWQRLREPVQAQLTAALEAARVAEEFRGKHVETIAALSRTLEAKDVYSGAHTERVAQIAVALGRSLGYQGGELDAIEIGALLHNIGKIGIPETILRKRGALDDDEWTVMKRYPVVSEFILSGAELSPIVLQIARSSHERLDGRGYPDGLRGDDIPLPARIVLVADAFDALTTDRPYRRARRPRAAVTEIVANAGEQFCPRVVEALERLYEREPALLGEVGRLTIVA